MTRFSGKWSLASLVGAVPSGIWYVSILPDQAQNLVLGKSPTIAWVLPWGTAAVVLLLIITLLAGIARPAYNLKSVALVSMVCGLLIIGSFEWTREAARRPYVLNEVMYSNSILKNDVASLKENGYLQSAIWVKNKSITPENRSAAGKELFIHQCYACHTLGGSNNDLLKLTQNMSYSALTKYIGKIHKVRYFMPPFAGTNDEAKALAAYIAGDLHGKEIADPTATDNGAISGKQVFEDNCSACHEPDDLAPALEGEDIESLRSTLLTLPAISDEMPPFEGSRAERNALADYLNSLNGGE
jgi:mono/diheme cytochrome c family protein